jgi:hypothetical protein
MWAEVSESLLDAFRRDDDVAALAGRLERDVAEGAVSPTAAAQEMLRAFRPSPE